MLTCTACSCGLGLSAVSTGCSPSRASLTCRAEAARGQATYWSPSATAHALQRLPIELSEECHLCSEECHLCLLQAGSPYPKAYSPHADGQQPFGRAPVQDIQGPSSTGPPPPRNKGKAHASALPDNAQVHLLQDHGSISKGRQADQHSSLTVSG